ncbi:MAG: nucleotidyltransferase family protein [Syntrophorhabdales bacterium]|nr:nucleotidyltransferase family protein [Syntrophorhabdales bacterium]
MKKRRFKTAFILGAGMGVRLKPLTETCPKPLLEVGGRPIITYAMAHLAQAGIDRFIINTHHIPDAYKKAFPDSRWKGIPIIFRYEPVLLETAGGLKNIEDLLSDDEAIICYNGDIISSLPLKKLIDAHGLQGPEATLALRSVGHNLNVEIDEEGNIIDMRYSLGKKGIKTCLFTGIYTIETSILRCIEPGKAESIVPVFLRKITDKPGSIRGVLIDEGIWYDIGTQAAYEEIKAGLKGIS